MGTTAQKLANIANAKAGIAGALGMVGATAPVKLADYPAVIRSALRAAALGTLTSYSDPDATEVPEYALYSRTLTGLSLPNVVTIGKYAFANTVLPDALSFPSATSVGNYSFYNASFRTLSADSLESVGISAFNGCTSLTTVSLPNVTSIRGSSSTGANFSGCTSLTTVSLPKVTQLAYRVFYGCTALRSIYCPELVTLGWTNTAVTATFYGCSSLESIALPKCTAIAAQTFQGCSSLMLVDFRGATSVPNLRNTSAFSSTPTTRKIVVPDALYDSWIATANWNATTNNIKGSIVRASDYDG